MRYKIINPHDYCTIDAPDDTIAGVATLMLGEGKYGLRVQDDSRLVLPIFLTGGHEPWLQEHGIVPDQLAAWIEEHEIQLADALATVALREGATASSLTDLCDYARWMARMLREKSTEESRR